MNNFCNEIMVLKVFGTQESTSKASSQLLLQRFIAQTHFFGITHFGETDENFKVAVKWKLWC